MLTTGRADRLRWACCGGPGMRWRCLAWQRRFRCSKAAFRQNGPIGCELLVGGMLIFLGGRAVILVLRALHEGQGFARTRTAGLVVHSGPLGHVHIGGYTFAHRPLLVGLFHGLAGSGALTALCRRRCRAFGIVWRMFRCCLGLARCWEWARLGALGLAAVALAGCRPLVGQLLTVTAGILSMGLGVLWSLPIVDRLWSGSWDAEHEGADYTCFHFC